MTRYLDAPSSVASRFPHKSSPNSCYWSWHIPFGGPGGPGGSGSGGNLSTRAFRRSVRQVSRGRQARPPSSRPYLAAVKRETFTCAPRGTSQPPPLITRAPWGISQKTNTCRPSSRPSDQRTSSSAHEMTIKDESRSMSLNVCNYLGRSGTRTTKGRMDGWTDEARSVGKRPSFGRRGN